MLPLLAAAAATTPTAEPPCKSPRTFRASVEAGLYGVPTHSRGEAGAGELFACGEQLILMSSVNDEYCDCADGSDEPRTGACPNQPFACTLPRQSQPVTVFASRVNDGVCDCCDGSDEWRSAVSCANQCTARHVPGGWAWLVIAVAALLSLLLGSMCLFWEWEPEEARVQVTLRRLKPEARLGLVLADAHGSSIDHPVVSALEEDGVAAQSGEVRVDDVLTSVNGQPARGAAGASALLRAIGTLATLQLIRTVPAPPVPASDPQVRRLLFATALCLAGWPVGLVLAAAPHAVDVGRALLGASLGAHLALLLASHAQEAFGRGCLALAAAGAAAGLGLLVLATPSHGVGAPSLLLLLLGAEACVLLARRRHAAHGELAAMLAHAAALPALCLLPDATASEHYAALGLAYANFLLRLIPHLRPSGAPDASMVARLGLRCLALLPIVLRGAMMWWAHPSFYRGGTGTAALRSPDEL